MGWGYPPGAPGTRRFRPAGGLRPGVAGHISIVKDRTGTSTPLRLTRPARATELRSIRCAVEQWAELSGVPADVVVDLQLALGEAVANGIEHAYGCGEPGTVEIELQLRNRTGIVVRVVDHGRWRPIPAAAGHRGRGLQMIEQIAGEMVVLADGSGTEVCFEIPLVA